MNQSTRDFFNGVKVLLIIALIIGSLGFCVVGCYNIFLHIVGDVAGAVKNG